MTERKKTGAPLTYEDVRVAAEGGDKVFREWEAARELAEDLINMKTEQEFIEELAKIHLKLYHLSLDVEATWVQAATINHILDTFDTAWDYYKGIKEVYLDD